MGWVCSFWRLLAAFPMYGKGSEEFPTDKSRFSLVALSGRSLEVKGAPEQSEITR